MTHAQSRAKPQSQLRLARLSHSIESIRELALNQRFQRKSAANGVLPGLLGVFTVLDWKRSRSSAIFPQRRGCQSAQIIESC